MSGFFEQVADLFHRCVSSILPARFAGGPRDEQRQPYIDVVVFNEEHDDTEKSKYRAGLRFELRDLKNRDRPVYERYAHALTGPSQLD